MCKTYPPIFSNFVEFYKSVGEIMETSGQFDSTPHSPFAGGFADFDFQWLVERCKKVTLQTDEAWAEIKNEALTIPQIYTKFIIPLAAADTIVSMLFLTYGTTGFFFWLIASIIGFALSLAGFYIAAIIMEFLSPNFGGKANARLEAFKLAAFSATPSLVTGIFCFTTLLKTIAGVLSLYGIYIMWRGITPMLEVPAEKRPIFAITLVVVGAVVMFAIGLVVASVIGMGTIGAATMVR